MGTLRQQQMGNLTLGSVPFSDTNGHLIEDNTSIFWDDTNNRLGLSNIVPLETLDIIGTVGLGHTAAGAGENCFNFNADAAGFVDVKAINLVYTTGAVGVGDRQSAILVDLDASLATGGMFVALDVVAIPGSSSVCAVEAGAQVQPLLHLSGGFGDMDSALVNAVDRLTEFTSPGSDIALFVADNDTVTIGNASKFQQLSFDLDTVASGAGIAPTFEFSTGVGTWAVFSPTDGTNGMRNSGNLIWRDSDIPSWAIGTGSEFLIRITRTRNSLSTVPIENLVQISSITEYAWGEDGIIEAATVRAENGTAALPSFSFSSSGNQDNGMYLTGANSVGISAGGTERLKLNGSETVFNEDSAIVGFRVEGNNDINVIKMLPHPTAGTDKVGFRQGTPLSVVDVNGSFGVALTTKTNADTPYTALDTDHTIICDAVAGVITVVLPTAASSTNRIYIIKKVDASVNAITIDGDGAETIDGAATQTLSNQYDSITVQSDGTEWWEL